MDRDFYMSAEEAKAYGIIDHVVAPRAEEVAAVVAAVTAAK